jgi:O-antigen ligase
MSSSSEPPPNFSPERLTPSAATLAAVIAIGAIACVLVAVPSRLFDLDRFSVPKELALHGAALLVAVVLAFRIDAIEIGVPELGLGLFALWSVITAIVATNWWLAARAIGVTISGIVLFFGARYAAAHGARRLVTIGLALAVLLGGVTGLAQTYGWASEYLADTRAPGGTLGNRNFMAHLMVIGLPLAGWLLATARRRAGVALYLALSAFAVAAIVLSRSRAAWVGLGATVVVVGLAGLATKGAARRLPRGRVRALGIAMAAGALAALALPNRLEWKSSTPYRDSLRGVLNYREGSGRGRLIQYQNSFTLVRRHPVFGVGPGNWVVAYPTVTTLNDPSFNPVDPMPTNPWPSSDWVALVAERAPIGMLLWLVALGAMAIVALRRMKDPDPSRGAAALAALGLLSAAGVQGLFDAVLLLAPPTFVLMAGLGALLPFTRPLTGTRPERKRRIAMAALLVLATFTAKSIGQVQAIRIAENGFPTAKLESAVRYDPGSFRLNYLLALRVPCPAARSYTRRLARLYPHHAVARKLAGRCGADSR